MSRGGLYAPKICARANARIHLHQHRCLPARCRQCLLLTCIPATASIAFAGQNEYNEAGPSIVHRKWYVPQPSARTWGHSPASDAQRTRAAKPGSMLTAPPCPPLPPPSLPLPPAASSSLQKARCLVRNGRVVVQERSRQIVYTQASVARRCGTACAPGRGMQTARPPFKR